MQFCVNTAKLNQLSMRAALDNASSGHDMNDVCINNRRQAVSNDDGRAATHEVPENLLDRLLRLAV